jgi:hypothetical protein
MKSSALSKGRASHLLCRMGRLLRFWKRVRPFPLPRRFAWPSPISGPTGWGIIGKQTRFRLVSYPNSRSSSTNSIQKRTCQQTAASTFPAPLRVFEAASPFGSTPSASPSATTPSVPLQSGRWRQFSNKPIASWSSTRSSLLPYIRYPTARLVVGSVTTSESLVLYVFLPVHPGSPCLDVVA